MVNGVESNAANFTDDSKYAQKYNSLNQIYITGGSSQNSDVDSYMGSER